MPLRSTSATTREGSPELSSHGHAAGQQNLDRRIEPKDGDPGVTQEFRAASLCVGAAAEGQDSALFVFGGASEGGAKLVGFELPESRLAVTLKELRYGDPGGFFDAIVEIDKAPGELASEQGTDCSLAGAHKAGEGEQS